MAGTWILGIAVFLGCVVLPFLFLAVTIQECKHAIANWRWFRQYKKEHKL